MSLSATWVAVAILTPLIVISLSPLQAIDLAYQLRAGGIMIDRAAILRADEFTLVAAGDPWLNQQWGSQVVLAAVFRGAGWLGLSLLRALLAGASALLIYSACRASGARTREAGLLTLAGGSFFLAGLTLRPQLFGVACFAAILWLSADPARRPRALWAVPVVVLLWTNLHGSFVLGPVWLLLRALQESREGRPEARRLMIVGVGSLFATIVNPFGVRVWPYLWEVAGNPIVSRFVQEWRRPTLDPSDGAFFFLSVAFLASVVAAVAVVARSPHPARWALLLTTGVVAVPGLLSIRGIYWWGAAAPVVVSQALAARPHRDARPDPVNLVNAVLVSILAAGFLIAVVRFLPYPDESPPPPRTLLSHAPHGITRELDAVLRPGEPLFGAQIWGSWFEFALPRNPVIADSRIEVIPATEWDRYLAVSSAGSGWEDVLASWGVDVVALKPEHQGPLIAAMEASPDWRLVYRDAEGSVFVNNELGAG